MPDAIRRWRPPPKAVAKPAKETAHYRTQDWFVLRTFVLVRDSFTCRKCNKVVYGKDAHVDHIVPLEDGGTDHPDNLQVLCASDHGLKTMAEQRARGHVGGGSK